MQCECDEYELPYGGPGWMRNANTQRIERCDTCKRFPDDEAARRAVKRQAMANGARNVATGGPRVISRGRRGAYRPYNLTTSVNPFFSFLGN